MSKNYYDILGISKEADTKQIKSAYRKLARKYHPDVNPNDKNAESKFKEVSQAYEVLNDPEKRKMYDQFGPQWESAQQYGGAGQRGASAEGFNINFGQGEGDPFGSIFDHFFGHSHEPPQTNSRQKVAMPHDVEQTLELTLEEIAAGIKKNVSYLTQDACKTCDGTGQVVMPNAKPCYHCQGKGVLKGVFGVQQACPHCKGTGKSSLEKCPSCQGKGTTPTPKKVEVSVPPGILEGKKLRVPGRGAVGGHSRAGDLYIIIKQIAHSQFVRKGDDLETTVKIPYYKAALGGEITIPTLTGRVTMTIPEGTQNYQIFRLSNKGMPKMGSQQFGSLYAKIEVSVPKKLSDSEKKLLQQIKEHVNEA